MNRLSPSLSGIVPLCFCFLFALIWKSDGADLLERGSWENRPVPGGEALLTRFGTATYLLKPAFVLAALPGVDLASANLLDAFHMRDRRDEIAKALPIATRTFLEAELKSAFSARVPTGNKANQPVSALVFTKLGGCLSEALVSEGLAVVSEEESPFGFDAEESLVRRQRLLGLQREAMWKGRGFWAKNHALEGFLRRHLPADPSTGSSLAMSAKDTNLLLEGVGRTATVRGTVSRVGKTSTGHINFINFSEAPRDGFVVIVREGNLEELTKELPGFPDSLIGKTLEITGSVSEYRGGPQMELRSASQITQLLVP